MSKNIRKTIFINTFLVVICILSSQHLLAQHTYGSFYTDDAYVNYILAENKKEDATIVMVPGANLSTYIYITTPDGRKGWAELFADKGYDVYMVNDPRYDFATGGFIEPFIVPDNGKEATPGSMQGGQNDIWRRWGFGTSQGNPYPDALFPTEYFDTFAENYPYLGNSDQNYYDAIKAVIDSTNGKVWLLAHSAGASRVVTAAKDMTQMVNGLILIEPAGPPDADDFPDLNGLNMLGVYGDYITSRNQTNRKLATEQAAEFFSNSGGVANVISLPEDSLVYGNSHLLMQDMNSKEIFEIVETWLQQFSSTTSIESNEIDENIRGQKYDVEEDAFYYLYLPDDLGKRLSKYEYKKNKVTNLYEGLLGYRQI